MAITWCYMMITCKPHDVILIGTAEFRNESQKIFDVYQTLSLLVLSSDPTLE